MNDRIHVEVKGRGRVIYMTSFIRKSFRISFVKNYLMHTFSALIHSFIYAIHLFMLVETSV